jgi:AbrB family looped-hinge helix DNA binding protein
MIDHGGPMKTVTVSPKFQVVIPREVRESLSIKPGEKMQVINYADRIEFVPIRKVKDMRGFLKGINTTVPREKDRI